MPSPESPNSLPTQPLPETKTPTSKLLLLGLPIIILTLLIGFIGFKVLGDNQEDSSKDQSKTQENEETIPSPSPKSTTKPNPTPPTTKDTTPPETGVTITPVPPPNPPQNPPAPANATITYTGSGFSPSTITLGSGGKLTIINSSGDSLDFASDPHPQHTINPQLNAGNIVSSKQITLTTRGTFGVHNHDRAAHKATIVVN